jgi:hypothetical protein
MGLLPNASAAVSTVFNDTVRSLGNHWPLLRTPPLTPPTTREPCTGPPQPLAHTRRPSLTPSDPIGHAQLQPDASRSAVLAGTGKGQEMVKRRTNDGSAPRTGSFLGVLACPVLCGAVLVTLLDAARVCV